MKKKILVIRFSSIGDIVLTTPVIRALHQQLGSEVHVLTKPAFAPLVEANPHVEAVIPLTDDWAGLIGRLQAERYDHIIDLHHNLRSLRIKRALGKPASSFRKLNLEKWMLVRLGINRLPDIHIVDRYLATAAGLGVVPDGGGLDLFIPPAHEVEVDRTLGLRPGGYACVAIGAAHATKCMTVDQLVELVRHLPMPVVLMGGAGDADKAREITAQLRDRPVINACGRFDILQSGSVLRQAGPVINHDSGLMHMAAAIRKPQVVVWGNTVPAFGMYPYYGPESPVAWQSFEQTGLRCRPCSKLGYPACPKGHFRCMRGHDMQRVAQAAMLLSGGGQGV